MIGIVQRSVAVVTFVGLLNLTMTAPQLQLLQRFTDLLVLTPRRKTLAQRAVLELDAVDASNLADFFRISPWVSDDLALALLRFVLDYRHARHCGSPPTPHYLSLDDSLALKDKGTRQLQAVDWHFDHNQHRTVQGSNHVVLRLHWGAYHFPLSWRLYLRQSTVRRLNRRRQANRLRYRSKRQLTQQMRQQVRSRLPQGNAVYVRFDSWYTSAKLVKWIRQQGWHVIAAVKSNRKVSGQPSTVWLEGLQGHSYDRVSLDQANGKRRTYCVRSIWGKLRGVPGTVRVHLSQTGPGVRAPKYFLSTDVRLSSQEVLRRYPIRWSQEVDFWYVKECLGLADYRLQSYEAIEKWYTVVYHVLVYLYWCRYEDHQPGQPVESLSEVMTRIRQNHHRDVLRRACEEAAGGTPVEQVLKRYLVEPRPKSA
jgi:hypothetical protein